MSPQRAITSKILPFNEQIRGNTHTHTHIYIGERESKTICCNTHTHIHTYIHTYTFQQCMRYTKNKLYVFSAFAYVYMTRRERKLFSLYPSWRGPFCWSPRDSSTSLRPFFVIYIVLASTYVTPPVCCPSKIPNNYCFVTLLPLSTQK